VTPNLRRATSRFGYSQTSLAFLRAKSPKAQISRAIITTGIDEARNVPPGKNVGRLSATARGCQCSILVYPLHIRAAPGIECQVSTMIHALRAIRHPIAFAANKTAVKTPTDIPTSTANTRPSVGQNAGDVDETLYGPR
jgi:hypothetical protein